MAAAKKASATEEIRIPPVQMEVVQIPIQGIDGPYVSHNWSVKAIGEILAKQMHMQLEAKLAKDPERDFRESLYIASDGGYGFPCKSIKKAMVRAAKGVNGLDMTEARQLLFVLPDCHEEREFDVPLKAPKSSTVQMFKHTIKTDLVRFINAEPVMRMDLVRLNGITADVHFRGEYFPWEAIVSIRYVASRMTSAQVANLVNLAGQTVGIGEGRPEKGTDMGWGKFKVVLD